MLLKIVLKLVKVSKKSPKKNSKIYWMKTIDKIYKILVSYIPNINIYLNIPKMLKT